MQEIDLTKTPEAIDKTVKHPDWAKQLEYDCEYVRSMIRVGTDDILLVMFHAATTIHVLGVDRFDDATVHLIRVFAIAHDVIAVTVIGEGWSAKRLPDDDPRHGLDAHERDDKLEVLLADLTYRSDDKLDGVDTVTRVETMDRDEQGNLLRFTPLADHRYDAVSKRFLTPEIAPPKIREAARALIERVVKPVQFH